MKQIHVLQLPPEVMNLLESLNKQVGDLKTELKEMKDLMAISEASFIQLEQKVKTLEENLVDVNQAVHDYSVATTEHINTVNENYTKAIAEVKTSATQLIEEVQEAANTSIAQVKEEAQTSITKLTERLAAVEKIHMDLATKELSLDLYDEDGQKADIQISKQLVLPVTDEFGCIITWESSNPKYVTNAGTVTIPTHDVGNVKVTMTATLKYGETTATKAFDLEIIAEEAPPEPEPPVTETEKEPGTETPEGETQQS